MQQGEEGVPSRHRIPRTGVFKRVRSRIEFGDFHLKIRIQKIVEFTHEYASPCGEMAVLAFFFLANTEENASV